MDSEPQPMHDGEDEEMRTDDNEQQQLGQQDAAVDIDEAPVFIQANECVEVAVDNDAPLDEDDDDDDMQVVLQDDKEPQQQPEQSSHQIRCHSGPVYCLETILQQPSEQQHQQPSIAILSGGGDDAVYITNIANNSHSQKLHAFTDSVNALAVHNNGPQPQQQQVCLAVGSYDGTIWVRTTNNDHTNNTIILEGPSDVEWVDFHSSGQVVLAGSTDGTVWLFSGRQCLNVLVGHQGSVSSGRFVGKKSRVVSISEDGSLKVWHPKTGKCQHTEALGAPLTCMDVRQGGGDDDNTCSVLVGGVDGTAHVFVVQPTKKVTHRLDHSNNNSSVEAVRFLPDRNWCATSSMDGRLKIWDLDASQVRHEIDNGAGITKLCVHQQYVIAASNRHSVTVYDARNGQLVLKKTGASSTPINDMKTFVDANGKLCIVTAGDDHVIRIFDTDLSA